MPYRLTLPNVSKRLMSLRRLTCLAMLSLVTACASQGSRLAPLPDQQAAPYVLGPGDQVRVTVFNDPRLTGEFRVTDAGTIALPLVSSVSVAGRSTSEVEKSIEDTMRRRNLFNNPSVAVEVTQYRPVFVLGMVDHGGMTPYQPGMTVLSAVAVVGGFNYRAVKDHMAVTRISSDGRAREYRAEPQSLLKPGDVVNVYERWF